MNKKITLVFIVLFLSIYSNAKTFWIILQAPAGSSSQIESNLLINNGKEFINLSSEDVSCARVDGNNHFIYSIKLTGTDFDNDAINDTLSFDVKVEGFSGSSYSYSANANASSMTHLGTAADVTSLNNTWGVGGDNVLDAGESLRFSISNQYISASESTIKFPGFSQMGAKELLGHSHKHIRGQGTGLESGIFQASRADFFLPPTDTFVVTGAGSTIGGWAVDQMVFEIVYGENSSEWDPFDYSIFKVGPDFIEDYAEQEDTSIYGEFSWDRVPRWLAVRDGNAFSEEVVQSIATNYQMVLLEKANNQGMETVEAGIISASERLKAVNPNIKTLFYWNTWINYYEYAANEEYEANKWNWSNLENGEIYLFKDRYYTYNYEVPELRNWWVKTAHNAVLNDAIDGVFCDKVSGYEGAFFNDGVPANNYIKMLDSLAGVLPEGKIMFGNTLRNERWGGSRGHMHYTDGSYWERWDMPINSSIPGQNRADAICVNMQLMREAVLKGKIVNFQSGPGHSHASFPIDQTEENMKDFYREEVQFPLGIFLIIADTNAYFSFQGSVAGADPIWKWNTSYLDEFHRPLGKPLGDPLKDGYVFTRSYEKVDVWVNVETSKAKLTWKDYPDFMRLKLVIRDSVTFDGIENVQIAVGESNKKTDALGTSEMLLDVGSYSITVSKSGYATKTVSYNFASDTTCIIDLAKAVVKEEEVAGYYQITKRNAPGYCLYAGEDGLMKEGDQITLSAYVFNDPGTIWGEIDRGDGYYSYQKINTNYCLDGGSGGASNQAVFISNCDKENYDQHWKKEELPSGFVRLKKRDVDFVINGGPAGSEGQLVSLWKSSVTSGNLEWKLNPVSVTSGIAENVKCRVKVYPNPVSDKLTITWDNMLSAKVEIINTMGVSILSDCIEGGSAAIDLNGLYSGVYFLRIDIDGFIKHQTFIKE